MSATLELYREAELRFTHETWNLRDLQKIMERIGEAKSNEKKLAKVWVHEAFHILGDRLTSERKEKLLELIS